MKSEFSSYNILVPDRLQPPADIEQAIFGRKSKIVLRQATHIDQIPTQVWQACHAILAWHDLVYPASLLETLTNCQVIVRVGVGYDNIDLTAARKAGITVCNVPDYGTNDVADHTIGFMLQASRGLLTYHRSVMEKQWSWNVAPNLRRVTGRTIGIIGFGRIGKAVALRAKAFGMRVIFYDPYVPEGIDKSFQVERVRTLGMLAAGADVVTVHTPLNAETTNMIDKEFLENCHHGVIIINTARGPIIDTEALFSAMQSGRVAAAGLDVLPKEPPDDSNPLYKALIADEEWLRGRLCITPHSAFFNKESYTEMRRKASEEALRVLEGKTPFNPVN